MEALQEKLAQSEEQQAKSLEETDLKLDLMAKENNEKLQLATKEADEKL